jgi:hypothetical protein
MIWTIITVVAIALLWSAWGYAGSHVEQADYKVVKRAHGYELRTYPAHIVAQTIVRGPYGQSLSDGFRILAGYIFGGNTKRESIAMTAPVVARKGGTDAATERIAMTAPVVATEKDDSLVISFGMPRSYTLETLPTPNDDRVHIVAIPAKTFAVMRFSWYRSDARVRRMQQKLLAALARDSVATDGSPAYAGYNAPWTPPWMNRHEVLVEVHL